MKHGRVRRPRQFEDAWDSEVERSWWPWVGVALIAAAVLWAVFA